MRILILNWRDIKNPSSGGAEILTHEIAKRLIVRGHSVIQLSSRFAGCKNEETIDGVFVVRMGNPDVRYFLNSIHFLAFLYYQRNLKGKVDVVIDEIHGIPFFTPWYVREKKVVLICEVAGDLWNKVFGFMFGYLGKYTEKLYLRYIYKSVLFFTISQSTKHDLIKNGVNKNTITILPMGVSFPKKIYITKKNPDPTLLFVGRLTKPKGALDAIYTLIEVIKYFPKTQLWIVGRGNKIYENFLKNISKKLNIHKNITFFGFVSEEKKFKLMSEAHILLHPSVHEGFGLTVPEAGIVGLPVIGYNSSGLRDLIKSGKNGILLSHKTPNAMAHAVITLLQDKKYYHSLCEGARLEASQFSWDKTADKMLSVVETITL